MSHATGSSLRPDPPQKITHRAGLDGRAAIFTTALPHKNRLNLPRGRQRNVDHDRSTVGPTKNQKKKIYTVLAYHSFKQGDTNRSPRHAPRTVRVPTSNQSLARMITIPPPRNEKIGIGSIVASLSVATQ